MPPPQTPASFPLHKFNHSVVSNTLVLSPRAICIHTTASFPTSNGFLRLKRFKQSMEEWTMNCKNSAQNALKVTIFRLKIENFFGEGAPNTSPIGEGDTPSPNSNPSVPSPPRSSRLRRSTLPPRLQILDPPLLIADELLLQFIAEVASTNLNRSCVHSKMTVTAIALRAESWQRSPHMRTLQHRLTATCVCNSNHCLSASQWRTGGNAPLKFKCLLHLCLSSGCDIWIRVYQFLNFCRILQTGWPWHDPLQIH